MMPARIRTISLSAQYATPSPYARQRPRCHQIVSVTPSTYLKNSQASRDLPTPATPTIDIRRAVLLFAGAVQQLLEEAQLAITPDERRLEAGRSLRSSGCGHHPLCAPQTQWLGLALELMLALVRVHDCGFAGDCRVASPT